MTITILSLAAASFLIVGASFAPHPAYSSPLIEKVAKASIEVAQFIKTGRNSPSGQRAIASGTIRQDVSRAVTMRACNPQSNLTQKNNGEKLCPLHLTETY